MRNISNSEVTTWLTCRMQYRYAFERNLAPKVTPHALARGTLGHLCFEVYVRARLEGSSHEQAMKAVQEMLTDQMRSDKAEPALVMEVKALFIRYMNYHKGWPNWQLLGTEERHDMVVTQDITIPIRYDLYYQDLRTGKKNILDFKLTYDFWSPDDHSLNGQMPKYITVMNNAGIQVDGGVLEEIRTRKLGAEKSADHKNLWRRTMYSPSIAKKRSTLKQHIIASVEITKFNDMSPEEKEVEAVPVLNKHGACKYCNFKELCTIELDGGNPDIAIEVGFTQNTYGYNDTVDIGAMI